MVLPLYHWLSRYLWRALPAKAPIGIGREGSSGFEDNDEGMETLCVRLWGAQNVMAALLVFALRGGLPYHRNRDRWLSECFSSQRSLLSFPSCRQTCVMQ